MCSSDLFRPQFGVLFFPNKALSIGATYLPEVKTFQGTMHYNEGQTEIVSPITQPSILGLGVTLSPANQWAFSAEYLHREYAKFNGLKDLSSFRIGIAYTPIKSLIL